MHNGCFSHNQRGRKGNREEKETLDIGKKKKKKKKGGRGEGLVGGGEVNARDGPVVAQPKQASSID